MMTSHQMNLLLQIKTIGGCGRSIFDLGVRHAGMDYHAAWERMQALAARGLVNVKPELGRRGSEFSLTEKGTQMSDVKIICVDAGFGNTKVAACGNVATLQSAVSIPNRVGTALAGKFADAMRVSLDDRVYAVGHGAWNLGEPLNSMDYLALVSPPRLALMYAGISKVLPPGDHGDVHLIMALPVPLLQDNQQMALVKSQLREMKRSHVWKIGDEEWKMNIVHIQAQAQPFGAFYDWLYNDELLVREGGVKKSCMVIDIGMKTIDLCAIENGAVSQRFLGGDSAGVYRLFNEREQIGYDMVELDDQLRSGKLVPTRAERDMWLGVILDVLERKVKSLRRFQVTIPTGGGVAILGEQLFNVLAAKGGALYMPQNVDDCITANVRGLWKHAAHDAKVKGE